jgi:hypothetical protein
VDVRVYPLIELFTVIVSAFIERVNVGAETELEEETEVGET